MKPAVLLLGGPTGAGKTAVAMELAPLLDAEIVSADARQVYRYLDIGTAKPTSDERARVAHHLLDLCLPDERYSAARFARDAKVALREIHGRGRRAIVTGGTGLYFRALTAGLFEAPETTKRTRDWVSELYGEEGIQGLRAYLALHDPATLSAIDTDNPARMRRAVEYHRQNGSSLALDRERFVSAPGDYRWYPLALTHPRAALEKRLAARLARMLECGWLGEVADLASRYDFSLPAFDAVGYRELYAVNKQELNILEAQERILLRTRQYAKRQVTWFRHQGAFSEVPAQTGVTAKIALGFRRFAENKSA